MCGIAGLIDRRAETSDEVLGAVVRAMTNALSHRGPDDEGFWIDAPSGVALGHRRLAIIDLSPTGHQPMFSGDGRYVVSYNGEIFNFPEVRLEIEAQGRHLRGTSDTEVFLEACSLWGVEGAVQRCVGMFAIALWDRQARTLYLIRDRLGIKPVYYRADASSLIFGSELKALRAWTGWQPRLNEDALHAYMRHSYVPAPLSIYREVEKVPPGSMLILAPGAEPRIKAYWDLREVARRGVEAASRETRSIEDATDELEKAMRAAVLARMRSDVPLGAFLSGGIDSSTVVALMQAQSNRPVKTFTIGFDEASFDEAKFARGVAEHLRTDHTELYVEPGHALDIIPRLPDLYDEPFADSSQIPTYLVSEMTRKHVTVALSGDGGDELFAGYRRYGALMRLGDRIDRFPQWMRTSAASMLRSAPSSAWTLGARLLPRNRRPAQPADLMQKLAAVMGEYGPDDRYRRVVSQWDDPAEILTRGREPRGVLWDKTVPSSLPSPLSRFMFYDMATYLPDDILTKVDRASMAVGLEARVPLLDHRLVELVWRLPEQLKLRDGTGKWLLRKILDRYVPRPLVERTKMGFGIPLGAWLRGPLRDWAEDLLSVPALAAGGVLRPEPARALWQDHLAGRSSDPYRLWTLLMFQAWRKRWMD